MNQKATETKRNVLYPRNDNIVLQRIDPEPMTAGGIMLPDSAKNTKEKPQRARVVAVGPGLHTREGQRIPLCLDVGMEVLFDPYGSREVELGGEKYVITDDRGVLAVVS